MIDVTTLDTKDALAEYAFSGTDFPAVKLDMRKKFDELKEEVITLQSKTPQGEAKQSAKQATHIKNRETGFIFEYTDALWNHLQDRVKCDANGNEV